MPRVSLAALLAVLLFASWAAAEPCPGVSCCARPSESRFGVGYAVGGGSPCRGDARCVDEGVWGWDYGGILFPKRIALLWNHGRKYQGGTGAYRTVGKTTGNPSSP